MARLTYSGCPSVVASSHRCCHGHVIVGLGAISGLRGEFFHAGQILRRKDWPGPAGLAQVWPGVVAAGAFWAQAGSSGSRRSETAANLSEEATYEFSNFIIQGIPCLFDARERGEDRSGGPKGRTGSRLEQLCLL